MSASDIKTPLKEGLGHFLRAKIGDYAMNSPTVSYFSKTLVAALFAACLILSPKLTRAQNYTEEEFKVYEDAKAEKDDAKKVDMIAKFLKEKPKNDLRPSLLAEYQKVINDLKNEKKWNQIISFGEKLIDAVPGDDFTETALALAYYETGNWKGYAAYGEKVYASKPSTALATEIAGAYQKLGNEAKALQWKEKVLASDSDNIQILMDTIQKYSRAKNGAQAVKYAKQCLSALPNAKKPAGADEQTWKNTVDNAYAIAYGVIGEDAYLKNQFGVAIPNLENAVKYYKRNDGAYYYLGMSYWQSRKMDAAMLNFAKAYIIRGANANAAKTQLDKLFALSKTPAAAQKRVMENAQ
jgi:tetratricopeptide (TPR) repeat protein